MNTGTWVLLIALAASLCFGAYRALTDGRFRGTHRVRGADGEQPPAAERADSVLAGTPWEAQAGSEYTLLQFSSAFCAPCRTTRRVLEDVAGSVPGVTHLDIDAEHHLDVVRRLGILRTPTTLILDEHGREIGRASGVPTRATVLQVLGADA
ncbi:thioredoxin family protein [Marmoricola sp. RAF53]|uniref:thioredoxin family protein n=1 Tax=Marmoricola sp. RAF53 TaxID=3233059 RepID=UPI003F9CE491